MYSFHTIVKSENCKFNQCKSRAICKYVINVGNINEEVQIGKAEVRSSNWEGEMRDAKIDHSLAIPALKGCEYISPLAHLEKPHASLFPNVLTAVKIHVIRTKRISNALHQAKEAKRR